MVPATTSAEDILAMKPDGVFLSNGPGDPAATGKYAVPVIQKVIKSGTPTFGICLGHQMLGLAVGAKTKKMHQGHHGANHPVKDETTGKVEITSMNHGFAVDQATLPKGATQTHISLFDGSNCGIQLDGKPVFSVQYHPEASPGPARLALSVPALCRSDAAEEERVGCALQRPSTTSSPGLAGLGAYARGSTWNKASHARSLIPATLTQEPCHVRSSATMPSRSPSCSRMTGSCRTTSSPSWSTRAR